MKRLLPTLLVTATVMAMSAKAADDAPAMKAPPSNSTDLGTPDPLSVLDENKNNNVNPPPPEVPTMPEFKDVPAAGANSSGGSGEATGSTNAEAPPPSENPESAPAPKPAKKAKKKRATKSAAREESVPANLSPDSPDDHREQSFHRVYEKYNAAPTPVEAWEQASAARTSEIYKVQKNDTLWDLSKTLFGDPNYWPKIWALNNDEVLNPHEIETWMQIRFYPGDLNEPPTVAVAETPKASKEETKADDLNMPAARRIHPLVRRLPPSIPQYKVEAARKILPPLEGIQPRHIQGATTASLTYSVSETPLQGVGQIKETELGMGSASEFQYVFVDVSSSTERVFTVVKEIGTLNDPRYKDSEVKRPIHLIEYQGEIEVVESVSDRGNLQRAIVRKNLTPIEVGSHLIPGRIESVNIEDGTPTAGPGAQIIGSQFNADRILTDAGGIIFLNAGSSGGVQPGMILPVYSNVRLRNPGTGARIHDREVAHAKVVKVTENYATAVLTKVSDDVMIGDSVGASATGNGTSESLSGAPVAPSALPGGEPGAAVVPADRASAAPSGGDDMDFDTDESTAPPPAVNPTDAPIDSGSADDLEL